MTLREETVKKQMPATGEVLVVDGDAKTCEAIQRQFGGEQVRFRAAATVEQALLDLRKSPADVVLINLQIADQRGAELIGRICKASPLTEAIALTRSERFELCRNAFRAGAADILRIPAETSVLQATIQEAFVRRQKKQQEIGRQKRLREVCKRLNKARHEIGQQVNLLCKDLVGAYRDLADQLHETKHCAEFVHLMRGDLDVESLLRKTMEYILKKVGPVNAAAFLPDSEGNYALGAYLNYDTPSESILTDLLGQTMAKEASHAPAFLEFKNDESIDASFGKQVSLLHGRNWMAMGMFRGDECFGVLVLFRNHDEPLDIAAKEMLENIAPPLATQIAEVLSVHHRLNVDEDVGDDPEAGDSVIDS